MQLCTLIVKQPIVIIDDVQATHTQKRYPRKDTQNNRHLLFCKLSTEDADCNSHLEISYWQDFAGEGLHPPFLRPTRDGINFNREQLSILGRLLLLAQDDFSRPLTASTTWRNARERLYGPYRDPREPLQHPGTVQLPIDVGHHPRTETHAVQRQG